MKIKQKTVPQTNLQTYAKLAAVSIIWGGTFIAGRYLGQEVAPLAAAFIRFLLASISLLIWLLISKTPLIRPNLYQLLQLAILGFFGIFTYNLCFFCGLELTAASRASLIVCLNPALIALASMVFYRERLNRFQALGICFCIGGAALVISSKITGDSSGSLYGDILILGCVVSWVIFSVASRDVSQKFGPLLTISYAIWLGTLFLFPAGLYAAHGNLFGLLAELSNWQWFSLLYLGIAGSAVAYIWYYDAIQKIGPTRSGAFIALNPVTAVIFGVLLFNETATPRVCLGGFAAILGITLCNTVQQQKKEKTA